MAKKNENIISIGDLLMSCVKKWYWFVISLAICMSVAMYKVSKAKPKYTCEATVMVLEEKEGKSATNGGNEFSGMKFVYQNDKLSNVVMHFTSLDVLMEVARRVNSTTNEDDLVKQALNIRSRFSADIADRQSTLINLSFWDYNLEKSKQILDMAIQVYDEKWRLNNRKIIESTSSFIDARLQHIEIELDSVEDSISKFKSSHKITDLGRVSDLYLQQKNKSDVDIMALSNQKSMAVFIRDMLKDKDAPLQPLPVNLGINNEVIESQISLYNRQLMQYRSHLDYTSEQNPRIVIQQRELMSLRDNIESDINNYIKTIDIQIRSLRRYNYEATSKIVSNPSQAMQLASIEREQKVKEDLYMYLLQKKEENDISGTFQSSNIKIIDIPHWNGSAKTGRVKTLAAALLLALLLPITIIFILLMNDKTIRDRDNVESRSSLELIGEIPFYGKKRMHRRKKGLVVGDGLQDPVNEAFRLLRTNMLQKTEGSVYMVTSFDKEVGKTFVSTNLAIALAIHNRRVLFIDGDLRDGDASQLFAAGGAGLSNYLGNEDADLSSMIVKDETHPNLDIMPSGDLPSNPTELLASPRFGDMISELRKNYDVIIIDTPESGRLADADIIMQQADTTLFVVRVGKTDRERLDELEASQQKNNNKLAIVLNN